MAGIVAMEEPPIQIPLTQEKSGHSTPSQGSPEKWNEMSALSESQKGTKTPQGKGVGIFGLDGSPPVCGETITQPVKDPKVRIN